MHTDATVGGGLMARLREETAFLHRETERGRLSQDLVTGRLPLTRYGDLLHQMLLLHAGFEPALAGCALTPGPISAVVRPYQYQEQSLRRDLAHLGRDEDGAAPLPAVREFAARVTDWAARNPVALLGILYVLEGSKNGGRYLARAVRRAYGFDGQGTEYLDPYGELQAERWQQFKADMDALPLTEVEKDDIVAAAASAFRSIMQLHQELDGDPGPGTAG